MATVKLSPAQQRFMDRLQERGYVVGGDGYPFRLTTARALERMGLIKLKVEVHNAWFGGYRHGLSPTTTSFRATPIEN